MRISVPIVIFYFYFLHNYDFLVFLELLFQKEFVLRQQREWFCTPAVIYKSFVRSPCRFFHSAHSRITRTGSARIERIVVRNVIKVSSFVWARRRLAPGGCGEGRRGIIVASAALPAASPWSCR